LHTVVAVVDPLHPGYTVETKLAAAAASVLLAAQVLEAMAATDKIPSLSQSLS
jgi:hypothetical protein